MVPSARNRVLILAIGTSLVLSLLLAMPAANTRASSSSTLVVVQQSDPGVLNNMLGDTLGSFYVNYNVYQELVHLSYNGTTVVPQLAQSWTISPDGLNYTFHLRVGVKWQDGQPFTANDVVYTMDTAMSLPAWYIDYLVGVTHVYADDPYNVSFVLSAPNAGWLSLFAFGSDFGLNILPAHLYEGTNITTNPYNQAPIGTGPYEYVSHLSGQNIVLKANPNYWGGEPSIQTVIILIVPDVGTAVQELEQGSIQYLDTFDNPIDYSQMPQIANDTSLEVSNPTGGVVTWVLFNTQAAPFNNATFRQAIAYGINRTQLVQKAYFGYAGAMYGFYLEGPWFNSSAQIPYDPTEAENLLNSLGYTPAANGTRVTFQLAYNPLFGNDVESEVIQAQLAQIGVNVVFWSGDYATWFTKVQTDGDYQMAIRASQIGPDPDLMWPWLDPVHEGESGATFFNNTTMNNLFIAAEQTTDVAQRQADYNAIQGILANQVPVLPLTNIEDINIWQKGMVKDLGPQVGTDRWDLSQAQLISGSSSSGLSESQILAIAVIVVIIVAIVGVVIYRRSRKKKTEAEEDRRDAAASGGSPPPGPGTGK